MRHYLAILAAVILVPSLLAAEAVPGKIAPDFHVSDYSGKTHNLQDYTGKWLVLEWFNKDCPYVKKHYGSGNMQKLQNTYIQKGVEWLTVVSSARGKQGYLEPAEAAELFSKNGSAATAVLLDPAGTMGKAYGAKTTPHMFVIDPKGVVVYAGAIDDNDSANPETIPNSRNYLVTALESGMGGQAVQVASTRPYGCSVKY